MPGDQRPLSFEVDPIARAEWLELRLAGVLRQLEQRLAELAATEAELQRVEQVAAAARDEANRNREEMQHWQQSYDKANRNLEETQHWQQHWQQSYEAVMACKTMRAARIPRAVYGRWLARRPH